MSKILLNEPGEFDYPGGLKGIRDVAVKKLAKFYSSSKEDGEFTVVVRIDHSNKELVRDLDYLKEIVEPSSDELLKKSDVNFFKFKIKRRRP